MTSDNMNSPAVNRQPRLVLGSGSPYRRAILASLGLDCQQIAPGIDETAVANEHPRGLALRLAEAKAQAVASRLDQPGPWIVIGSDQVCHSQSRHFGKPGNADNARIQLGTFSNAWVTFSTGLCLITHDGQRISRLEDFECKFRPLTTAEIDRYIATDQPFDCAGSIRAEAAGLLLMETTLGRDINTLHGLPVMLLRESLAELGWDIFDFK